MNTNDRIDLGQCFNLAHNEFVRTTERLDGELIRRTLELFKLKKKLEREIAQHEN